MIDPQAVDLARVQFAATALYHFLFVPLTLGLSWLLVIMESAYVLSGRTIYRDMTQFWGKLFGINFALGVTTGLTMEFQFGTNWAYYSHYVGDIFGAPLAIEGLMAFFLESTMVGLFFFGWQRLSKAQHLVVTTLMALGTNLSAVLILIANGWMQEPVGAVFNPHTLRMELIDFWAIVFNPAAQSKFVHTVSAGYVTGSIFVLAISSWYLLRNRHVDFAKRSFRIAAAFGLASAASVIVLGDESGYTVTHAQQSKLAAMEGMWEAEPAPAGFTVIASANEREMRNDWEVRIPWVLGLLATRSTDKILPGIKDIVAENERRIRDGREAVLALEAIRKDPNDAAARERLAQYQGDLGYGLLLKKYVTDVAQADEATIKLAARESVPKVWPLFWTFRFMVLAAFLMLALFIAAFWHAAKGTFAERPWLLKWAFWSLPLPWLAAHAGWFVAEYGRQPWTVHGLLPTHLSASTLATSDVWGSLAAFIGFYTLLLVVELYLMFKYARLGPQAALPSAASMAQPATA
ncbi:MAG: cytochrome ubiquinol oxidase subunit I [Rhodocyclaceae bacterium]|jgi:cytochrome d ubiquinol oxidase subunit I|nr:cytochrome ubiquinol oxidase subunit I [Rhodocyclaceae bacterium]